MRHSSSLFLRALLVSIIFSILYLVYAIIGGTRSDSGEVFTVVRKLFPAGTCLCESSAIFRCGEVLEELSRVSNYQGVSDTEEASSQWEFQYGRDDQNVGLTVEECSSSFPGLFEDITRAVRDYRGKPVCEAQLNAIKLDRGMARAMIFEGKLHVIEVSMYDSDHRKKVLGALQSMHRSISILPDSKGLPNIEFVLVVDDMAENPSEPLWVLSRRPQDTHLWLMPDFAFWSWDLPGLGPYDGVVSEIARNEGEDGGWSRKMPNLFWRGKLPMAPKLRNELIAVTKGKEWSDVEPLVPYVVHAPGQSNYASAADQCNSMFIAHVEGRSYSGSLKYRLACNSVSVLHKLQWIEHYHYLLSSSGPQQNYVEVERDFSDLVEKMEYYLNHTEEAERIAKNSVKTFRERYLTTAAEACYWRALIRGWAEASFEPRGFEIGPDGRQKTRGIRFENFVLLDTNDQMNFGQQVT